MISAHDANREMLTGIDHVLTGLKLPHNDTVSRKMAPLIVGAVKDAYYKATIDHFRDTTLDEIFVAERRFVDVIVPRAMKRPIATRLWSKLLDSSGVSIDDTRKATPIVHGEAPRYNYVRTRLSEQGNGPLISATGLYQGLMTEELRTSPGMGPDYYGAVLLFIYQFASERQPETIPEVERAALRDIEIRPKLQPAAGLIGL